MPLSVITKKNEKQLITNCKLKKGTLIFNLTGDICSHASKYSIQIDQNKHIDVPKGKMEDPLYCWAFLNHSCTPNTYIKNKQLIAITDISPKSELTFNYNTTEYKISNPFKCNCSHKNCRKEINGYKYLTEEQKIEISDFTAPYLKNTQLTSF